MNKAELAKRIKEVAFLEGDFVLRSGKHSKYYVDKYLFGTQPDILKSLAVELAKILPPLASFDRLAGPELGAVTITSVLACAINKPFVLVRKAAKGYGTDKIFEGELNNGERVVLIEDILTTAGAALSAAERLRDYGAEIVKIIGVVDREEGAAANIAQAGFLMDALFRKSDLGI
ncbi:orotate phosphoribosyltransferase [Candidatus Termititenax persephonae]|uniref:Orotate phosphoribosyltransferase n=1 Tax=Candidatus Termititenax persephonae TaxID=2218525 RepID=A0A388TGH2_9BACT|nr:orotate phosphoribosyltransferase [Candidatus Termititenax persephonae]